MTSYRMAGASARRRSTPAGIAGTWRRSRQSTAADLSRRPLSSGHGEDELAAMTDPANRLRELRDIERRMALEEKARAVYSQGAAEHSRATLGRALTQDELKGVMARYRGR